LTNGFKRAILEKTAETRHKQAETKIFQKSFKKPLDKVPKTCYTVKNGGNTRQTASPKNIFKKGLTNSKKSATMDLYTGSAVKTPLRRLAVGWNCHRVK
jgi:hypothetical protein